MKMLVVALGMLAGCAEPAMTIDEYPCPPTGTQLTYDSFGRGFFIAQCNSCHSAEAGGRDGAPASYRFDTLDDVRLHKDRIFVRAAATNTSMPIGPNDPSSDDRDRLAEWLACGAP